MLASYPSGHPSRPNSIHSGLAGPGGKPPAWLKPFVFQPLTSLPSSLSSASLRPQVLVVETSKEKEDKKRSNRVKLVFQESSLYPNLLDLETELSPPDLPMRIHFCPRRFLRSLLKGYKGTPSLRPQPGKEAPPKGLGEKPGASPIWWKKTNQKPPPPQSRHFQFGRGLPKQTENGHTSTGPFPPVIFATGKLRPLHSLKNLRASLTF